MQIQFDFRAGQGHQVVAQAQESCHLSIDCGILYQESVIAGLTFKSQRLMECRIGQPDLVVTVPGDDLDISVDLDLIKLQFVVARLPGSR